MKRTNLEACFAVVVAVLLCGSPAAGAGMLIENATAPFGEFGGVDYVVHTGRLVGSTTANNYRVPYEIVAPADPRRGNGVVVVGPPHFQGGPVALDVLGHGLLFGGGSPRCRPGAWREPGHRALRKRFTHAAVGWSFDGNSILDPSATDVYIEALDGSGDGFEDLEIISDFARALRAGPAIPDLGGVEGLYGFGVSQTSMALLSLLYLPAGQDLFDFTILTVLPAGLLGDALPSPFAPPHLAGRMIVLQSEGDLILWDGALVRGNDDLFPSYRSYEMAGMAHLASNTLFEGPPQQDWRPFARGLFLAGHCWTTAGVPPPPSVGIESATPDELDPVYGFPTGIARDEIGNALGGIRPPDLELGRAYFVAAAFEGVPIPGFMGAFIDLQCTDEFQVAFPNHGRYVSAHRRKVRSLVRQRFLLRKDALEMHIRAAQSDVGKPGSCP